MRLKINMLNLGNQRQFPCQNCKAQCCGPIPLSAWRLQRIMALIATFSPDKIERLASQKRKPIDCAFLDIEKFQCSIYSERPAICRLFGYIEKMKCPYVKFQPKKITADIEIELDDEPAIFSNQYKWTK